VPQIEVIFDIDYNGILNVQRDKGSGEEQSISAGGNTLINLKSSAWSTKPEQNAATDKGVEKKD